jgi:hypothetical protein
MLPKLSPEELIEELLELGRESLVAGFPHSLQEETIEADAAAFITSSVAFLTDLASGGGEHSGRAQAILSRLQ